MFVLCQMAALRFFLSGAWTSLHWFLLVLLEFHLSELLIVLIVEPEELEWSSLLLSKAYLIAMSAALFEYTLEVYMFHSLKLILHPYCRYVGLTLIVFGELLRKSAWATARSSFTHKIKDFRRRQHILVTHGIYSVVRHPGYLGWLIWSVGTQVLLGNPICFVAFAYVSWNFFKDRIPLEEYYLHRIFGNEYVRYKARVPTGIPGIS